MNERNQILTLRDQIEDLLSEGKNPIQIARELDIKKGYVYQVKSELQSGDKQVTFRCPKDLFDKVLRNQDNKSDFIKKILEKYSDSEEKEEEKEPNGILEDLVWFYLLFNRLSKEGYLKGALDDQDIERAKQILDKIKQLR